MTQEEVGKVNTQLRLVAETCSAHLTYMQDADELTHDDYGLQILEEGYLFLYQVWLEAQNTNTESIMFQQTVKDKKDLH